MAGTDIAAASVLPANTMNTANRMIAEKKADMALNTTPAKRKKEHHRLPGSSVYLIFLIGELLTVLYIQGRIVLDPKWYGLNFLYATIAFVLIKLLSYCLKRLSLAGSSLRKIDKMTGEEFEAYLGLLYGRKGYKVRYTPASTDFGADLLIKKKGVKTVVQAKRYKNAVGEASVQQALSGKGYYDADQCVVITNSYFTPAAEALAERTGVTLIDREQLGTRRMYV